MPLDHGRVLDVAPAACAAVEAQPNLSTQLAAGWLDTQDAAMLNIEVIDVDAIPDVLDAPPPGVDVC